ncbi:MAG TPA: MFS transporter [Microthrixaceae bacterium]|nr:MFS transporter [Microthrixaceae bacterium]
MRRFRLAVRETFASLKFRNFRLFFVGQTISQVGNWLTLIAQTLLVLKLTNSGTALGFLAAAQFAPILVLGAWAGVIADRSDKRKLLIFTQSLAMLQSFVLGFIAFSDHPPVLAIFAIAFFGGLVTAFDNPARRSFVVEMVPIENVNNAVSLNSALMTGSRVVGPAVAGLLVATVGFGWTFILDAVSYVAVIGGLVMMRPSELRVAPQLAKAKGQIREGLRYARSVSELWVPLVMMALVGTFAFNFSVVFPVFVTKSLGGSDSTFTLLFSWLSFGSLVGALTVARRSTTSVRVVSLAALAFGVTMIMMAAAPVEAAAFVLAPLLGAASIAFMTSSTAIVQTASDPSMRGRVLALQSMVFLGSTPIGGPIVGFITEEFGSRYAILVGAAACLLAGAWGVRLSRKRGLSNSIGSSEERIAAEAARRTTEPENEGGSATSPTTSPTTSPASAPSTPWTTPSGTEAARMAESPTAIGGLA